MLIFCLHSLFREYGWQFISRVAVPHPVRTAKAVVNSAALDFSGEMSIIANGNTAPRLEGARSIVGVGFCLKPMNPPCPAGRSNHDCHYLEHLAETQDIPPACRQCAIRKIGLMTLKTGAAFYIMTSARDILFDVFKPALDKKKYVSGLFTLCRYSMRPFAVGMLASGIRGWLIPFEKGDCRDYKTWLLADRGIKNEQTEINDQINRTIIDILGSAAKEAPLATQYTRQGNVLYPGNETSLAIQ